MRGRGSARWAVRVGVVGALCALTIWAVAASASADGVGWANPPADTSTSGVDAVNSGGVRGLQP